MIIIQIYAALNITVNMPNINKIILPIKHIFTSEIWIEHWPIINLSIITICLSIYFLGSYLAIKKRLQSYEELERNKLRKKAKIDLKRIDHLVEKYISDLTDKIRKHEEELKKEVEKKYSDYLREKKEEILERINSIEKLPKENVKAFQQILQQFLRYSNKFLKKVETEYCDSDLIAIQCLRVPFDSYYLSKKNNSKLFDDFFDWANNEIECNEVEPFIDYIKGQYEKISSMVTERDEGEEYYDFQKAFCINNEITGRIETLIELQDFFVLFQTLFNRFTGNDDYDDDQWGFEDFFSILGVDPNTSYEEVKKAYYEEIKKHHSDLHNNWTEEEKKEHDELAAILNEYWKMYQRSYGK